MEYRHRSDMRYNLVQLLVLAVESRCEQNCEQKVLYLLTNHLNIKIFTSHFRILPCPPVPFLVFAGRRSGRIY